MAGRVDVDVGKPLHLWTQADSQAVAEAMKRAIIERTDAGTDSDGKPLANYRARKRKGQRVTLRKSNKMLDGLAARGTPKRAAVRTTVKYARVQDRIHNWFGLTEEQWRNLSEETIAARVQAHVDASKAKEVSGGQ